MHTIDEIIIQWFGSDFGTNFSGGIFGNILLVILSLLLAAVLTGWIGLEREIHGHSAGLRTHLLVAIGSALIMLVSIYGFRPWDSQFLPAASRDPARLAAQVVAGIGFIGAGTIIKNGVSVRGLTTATTLWVSMAIGLACGSGNFVIAIIATIVAVVALISMRRIERIASKKQPVLVVVFSDEKPIMQELLTAAEHYGVVFREQSSELVTYNEKSAVRMTIRIVGSTPTSISSFLEEVRLNLKPLEFKVLSEN